MMSSTDQTLPPSASFPAAAAARAGVGSGAERLSRLDKIQTAMVFYTGVWAISPPLFVNDWARLAAVVAVTVWLFCEATRRSGIVFRPGLAVLVAVFYAVYTGLTILSVDGPDAVVGNIQTFIFVLFFVQFQAAMRHGLGKYRWVLWASLGPLALWMAITVGALRGNGHIARELVRSNDETLAYAATGIGGYGLVYTALWAIPPLFYLVANLPPTPFRRYGVAMRRWAIVRRALAIATLVLAVVLVTMAGYSLAVLSLVLGAMAYLLLRGRGHGRSMRIILALAVAILALGAMQTDFLVNMLGRLEPLTEGTNYHLKLQDMQATLRSDSAVGTVGDRTERYMRSVRLFVEKPVVGTRSFQEIGKHSMVLDHFARFGIIGGLPLLFILFSVPMKILRASATRPAMAGVAFSSLVLVLVITISNDISASMGFVLYLIYPLVMTYWRPPRPVKGRVRRFSRA